MKYLTKVDDFFNSIGKKARDAHDNFVTDIYKVIKWIFYVAALFISIGLFVRGLGFWRLRPLKWLFAWIPLYTTLVPIVKEAGETIYSMGLNAANSAIFILILEVYIFRSRNQVINIQRGINYNEVSARIERATRQVVIITTYLWPLTLPENDPTRELFLKSIRNVLGRNNSLNFKIMLLHPKCDAATSRADALAKKTAKDFINNINKTIFEIFELRHADHEIMGFRKIDLRMYDFSPSFFYLQCDDEVSIIHFPADESIQEGDRIDSRIGNSISNVFFNISSNMWHRSSNDYISLYQELFHVSVTSEIFGNPRHNFVNCVVPFVFLHENKHKIMLLFRNSNSESKRTFELIRQLSVLHSSFMLGLENLSVRNRTQVRYLLINCDRRELFTDRNKLAVQNKYGMHFDNSITLEMLPEDDPNKEYD